jgi:hypothetical protein
MRDDSAKFVEQTQQGALFILMDDRLDTLAWILAKSDEFVMSQDRALIG